MPASEIVEPGRYDYELTVEFPSVHIPEHTPPAFRNDAAYEATRTRYASGQFDLAEQIGREVLRGHFVRQVCEDVGLEAVTVARFELTPVTR